MSLLSFIAAILVLLPSGPDGETAFWDKLLDKYEALCNACLEKKSKKEIQLLSEDINELLKRPEGEMNKDQRARFASIQNKYRGFITVSDETYHEIDPPRLVRVDTVRRYEHIRVTDTVFVKEILGFVELNQHISNKDTVFHIIQYQAPAVPEPSPVSAKETPAVTHKPDASVERQGKNGQQDENRQQDRRPTYMVLGNAGIAQTLSYGATIGVMSRWGGYVSFHSDFNKLTPDYSCLSDGTLGDSRIMANGSTSHSRLSITTGALYEITAWLTAYAGAGYGSRDIFWQDIDDNWMKVEDLCIRGAEFETGGIFHLGIFGISFGVSTTLFHQAEFKVGLGLVF